MGRILLVLLPFEIRAGLVFQLLRQLPVGLKLLELFKDLWRTCKFFITWTLIGSLVDWIVIGEIRALLLRNYPGQHNQAASR